VQAEGVVELQRPARLAERGEGDAAAQGRVVGVAHGRGDRQTVHAAAADHHHQLAPGEVAVGVGEGGAAEEADGDAEAGGVGER